MKELEKGEVREFVRELSKLSRRYKISIGGCGCCGSPFLTPMGKSDGRYEVTKDFDGLHWKMDNDESA
jgi:hypothetical protein